MLVQTFVLREQSSGQNYQCWNSTESISNKDKL